MLSVFMLVSLTVACSINAEKPVVTRSSSVNASATPEATKQESASRKYPASMTYWVRMDPDAAVTLKSYSEMGLYKHMEKITGTKVEFQHPPATESGDQFNLMMATGKLPDVIYTGWPNSLPDKAIKDGRILRLNELINKYAPNLAQLLKNKPYIKKAITSDGGNIYAFPSISEDPQVFAYEGLMVRKDWLDKLNLQPPTTIDDWEKMLIAFRDGDPNGNGKKDETPFTYIMDEVNNTYAFMGAYGITSGFYQDKNVIKYGPAQPQFKDYLTMMNKWYKEGLIDKDYLTSNTKIVDGKMLDNQLGSMVGWAGSGLGKYMQLKKDKDPNFRLVGMPFPTLKAGDKALSKIGNLIDGNGAAISASAKNPEQIAAWLDYAYSKEGSLLNNFGVEGESYTIVNGEPQYTDLILHNPKKLSVSQALSAYNQVTSSGPFALDKSANLQWHADPETSAAMSTWVQADHSKELPAFSLNAYEQSKFAAIMTDLKTYEVEMVNKFIMGAEPLSKFDAYTATLTKLGIENATKLKQDAYDRYLKK